MSAIRARSVEECRYDVLSLGEIMLRLDPGDGRVHTTRHFQVWEGGGEYNVARGLRRCFGLRAAVVTALVDNPVGRLVEDLVLQGGVDTAHVRWVPDDGIGRSARNGLNFTERGFGVRGATGTSDRGHTAVSQMQPGEVDWDHLFGELGVRWFHTGGIFAALSDSTHAVAEQAMQAAQRHGTIVSYDLNYRPSLWKGRGGRTRAEEASRQLAPLVDVLIGFPAHLGLEPSGEDEPGELDADGFRRLIEAATETYPTLSVVGSTIRGVRSASRNDWGGIAWSQLDGFVESTHRPGLEILDRVGGGDCFASGLIYGLLTDAGLRTAVEYGAAHGALAMTTPGDTSMATLAEVQKLVTGGGAGVER